MRKGNDPKKFRSLERPLSPGAALQREIESRGWTARDLAQAVGLSEGEVAALLRSSVSVSHDVARKLSSVLATSADLWLDIEREYRGG